MKIENYFKSLKIKYKRRKENSIQKGLWLTPAGELLLFFTDRYVHIAETMRTSEHYSSCVTVTLFCTDRCHPFLIKPTKLARQVVVAGSNPISPLSLTSVN